MIPFRFVFTHGKTWTSRLIRFFTRSKHLSHVAGAVRVYRAEMLLESSSDGVDFLPAQEFARRNVVGAVVTPKRGALANPRTLEGHLTWLIDTYGAAEYDYLAAGAIGVMRRLRLLWSLLGKWLRSKLSPSKVHCSELWTLLLRRASYAAVRELDPQLTDPLALLRALARYPDDFEVIYYIEGLREEVD